MKLAAPVAPGPGVYISQRWGEHPENYTQFPGVPYHNGLDVVGREGILVRAMAAGILESWGWDPFGYGFWCQVRHAGFYTRYAHGVRGSGTEPAGAMVMAGQPLFTMGSTGNSSGRHTHVEIRSSNYRWVVPSRSYLSDGGNWVIDPGLYLPAPFGEGREIGDADVNDTVVALEKQLTLSKADRDLNYNKFIEAGADLGDAIRILNRTPSGAITPADVVRRTELNTRWAGKV